MNKWTKAEIRAIEALNKNWHVLEKVLDEDILQACLGLGSDPNMAEAEIHFRRGAIHASRNFKDLARKLSMAAESQQAMESVLTDDSKKS